MMRRTFGSASKMVTPNRGSALTAPPPSGAANIAIRPEVQQGLQARSANFKDQMSGSNPSGYYSPQGFAEKGMKKGGMVSASKRADGCAKKGKTKGRMV